ncbi:MAG: YbaB/EbfC family nucleoid-associated protein [Sporichthyaceae bacterium]|nr:YbaB/EbfC family nucleoid-associated protein [Sporichthyaceae bacterium]
MFPGGEDMQQLLAHAQQLQEQLMVAQEQLAKTVFTGTAGGGLVTARVSGAGELVGLDIDPQAADPEDTETLADLVIAAVRDANHAAKEAKAHALGPLAEGLGGFGGLTEPGGGVLGPGASGR